MSLPVSPAPPGVPSLCDSSGHRFQGAPCWTGQAVQVGGGEIICCYIFFLAGGVHSEELLSRGAEGMSGLLLPCLPQKPWVGIEGPAFFLGMLGPATGCY